MRAYNYKWAQPRFMSDSPYWKHCTDSECRNVWYCTDKWCSHCSLVFTFGPFFSLSGIRTALLESEYHTCPTCNQSKVSPDTLIANKFLRQVNWQIDKCIFTKCLAVWNRLNMFARFSFSRNKVTFLICNLSHQKIQWEYSPSSPSVFSHHRLSTISRKNKAAAKVWNGDPPPPSLRI